MQSNTFQELGWVFHFVLPPLDMRDEELPKINICTPTHLSYKEIQQPPSRAASSRLLSTPFSDVVEINSVQKWE